MEGSLLNSNNEPPRDTAAGLNFKDIRLNERTKTQKNTRSKILFKWGLRTGTENPADRNQRALASRGGDWLESWRWQASGVTAVSWLECGLHGWVPVHKSSVGTPQMPAFPQCTFHLNVWTDWKQKVKLGRKAGLSRVAKRMPRWWHHCLGYEAKGTSADWNARRNLDITFCYSRSIRTSETRPELQETLEAEPETMFGVSRILSNLTKVWASLFFGAFPKKGLKNMAIGDKLILFLSLKWLDFNLYKS